VTPGPALAHRIWNISLRDSTEAIRAYLSRRELHIIKKLIERQGGTIRADNAPEGGACLELVLPELEGNAG